MATGIVCRPGDQHGALNGRGFAPAFCRGDLGGLVLVRDEPGLMPDHDLDGQQDGERHGRHAHLPAGRLGHAATDNLPGASRKHDSRGGDVSGDQHVGQSRRETGGEDNLHPVGGVEVAGGRIDGKALRRLHPAIGRYDPEGGNRGADGDGAGGNEVELATDLVPPEQHDAKEGGLKEEGCEDFIAEKRADHTACDFGEDAPVRTELVAHHHAGNDAHREGEREDFDPVHVEALERLMPCLQPQTLANGEKGREADRERWKHDVEGNDERELDAR